MNKTHERSKAFRLPSDPIARSLPTMRPQLRLAFEHSEQRHTSTMTTEKPPLRIRPYIAVYVVQFTRDGLDVWDGDFRNPVAVFEIQDWEDALDFAQNLANDRETVERVAALSPDPVAHPEGLVVGDHTGLRQVPFRFPWIRPAKVKAEQKRTAWFWRMIGWRK